MAARGSHGSLSFRARAYRAWPARPGTAFRATQGRFRANRSQPSHGRASGARPVGTGACAGGRRISQFDSGPVPGRLRAGQGLARNGVGCVRPYRLIPAAERARTLAHVDALIGSAADALEDGWHGWESDPICAEARRLGLLLWPTLRDRLMAEAGC
jgi:hypothetical protein